MPTAIQRFCPICDGAFARGDALVQCEGCGVLYHPACWHRTGRCVTAADHQSRVVARPYGLEPLADGALDAVIAAHAAPPAPAPAIPPPAPAQPRTRHNPPYDTGFTPPPPRVPRAAADPAKAPMPRVYGSRRWLRYWYVPAAAALTAATAYAVVVAVDAVFGVDTTSTIEPAASTTVISQTPIPGQATGSAASVTPAVPSSVATGVPGARFQPGQQAVVTGTGECLNIRAEASTGAPVIDCVPDGAVLTILEGPASAEGRAWWRVNIASANGWAADEYLHPR